MVRRNTVFESVKLSETTLIGTKAFQHFGQIPSQHSCANCRPQPQNAIVPTLQFTGFSLCFLHHEV